jgi:acyl-[acyl carrier protein]--UDP-N-acetylglucosamine O-acyltransferase
VTAPKKLTYQQFTNYYLLALNHIYLKQLSELQNESIDEIEEETHQIFVDDIQSKEDFEDMARETEETSLLANNYRFIQYLTLNNDESTN